MVSSFWGIKKKFENKKNVVIFPLILLGQQGLGLHFVELPTYRTFRVTNKQYYKIIIF